MPTKQHVFGSTDYGDMTLAKLGPSGVQFLLESVNPQDGKWGDFVVLLGKKDGEPFEIRAGGRAATGFLDKKDVLVGKVISIIPHGSGMEKTYDVSIVG